MYHGTSNTRTIWLERQNNERQNKDRLQPVFILLSLQEQGLWFEDAKQHDRSPIGSL
jgi:hypothetical protein